jgi:alanine-glyoxylate transaminase/serine-glyoxylate transaminase/serine-pyruvate transaminase
VLCDNGHFASQWGTLAENLGIVVHRVAGDWRMPPDPAELQRVLSDDTHHAIAAVLAVHNETSTGVTADIEAIRSAIDGALHPALLIVDTISSLASIKYRHGPWRVDVTVGCSQKGLMLPPGLGFNAMSDRALAARRTAQRPRAYWDWAPLLETGESGFFPYTPPTSLLFALDEALNLINEEGLATVWARHLRHAEATRVAVEAWGLELFCKDVRAASSSVTGVLAPPGCDTADLLTVAREQFGISLGAGLGRLAGRVFRVGHLGDLNDLMLCAALSGVELALDAARVPCRQSGVAAAVDFLKAKTEPSKHLSNTVSAEGGQGH